MPRVTRSDRGRARKSDHETEMSNEQQATQTQHERFIETARELGCNEDEAAFEEKLRRIATVKPKPKPRSSGPLRKRSQDDW
jgi:hypothetical protein